MACSRKIEELYGLVHIIFMWRERFSNDLEGFTIQVESVLMEK